MKMKNSHFVYIVRCSDGTFYTGYTNDLERRLRRHNSGTGAKYVRGRLPVSLVYVRRFRSIGAALRAEYALKQLTRQQKSALVARYDAEHPAT
jgi:putative endonuclease